jgi:acyl-CoA reductase-like NAD-dependent aldehyde dehydrogenase
VAMGEAHNAQLRWKLDAAARTAALLAAADAVDGAARELGTLLTAEQGKPVAQAIGEAKGVAAWLRYFANIDLPREVIQDDERVFAEVVRRPIGVVAAITPWNFPLSMAAWKFAPALRAGNTVVVKPSPYTPLATLRLGEVLRDALPPGVLNIVSGSDQLGGWMTSHPLVRKISFTGSVATGKKVAAAAAPDLKRVTLELGGNDPAILLDDIDTEKVAEKIFWSAFRNSGQVCIAVKRVYVPERLHDDLVEALAARARAAKVDDGMAEGTDLGPINNKPQFERVTELVSDALSNGATAVTGGGPLDRPGYFFAPTVLTGASDGTRIVDEEQFGPALPVIPYRDVDDALARANATTFGLGGSVWSADPDRAADVAERLETGTAWVNTHAALSPQQPFGGAKWSGIGVENGSWGLLGYTDIQVVHRSKK